MQLKQEYEEYNREVNGLLADKALLLFKLMNTENSIFKPTRKHLSDAGFDCRARLDEPLEIPTGGRACIPLGFGINIPLHHTGDLRPRSGLTRDHGIMVGYGTIDAGYTGEVMATVFNLGDKPFTVHPMDRIAQLVILPIAKGNYHDQFLALEEVDQLVELDRGANGHGSTGVK